VCARQKGDRQEEAKQPLDYSEVSNTFLSGTNRYLGSHWSACGFGERSKRVYVLRVGSENEQPRKAKQHTRPL
jgi:hypothetical protein